MAYRKIKLTFSYIIKRSGMKIKAQMCYKCRPKQFLAQALKIALVVCLGGLPSLNRPKPAEQAVGRTHQCSFDSVDKPLTVASRHMRISAAAIHFPTHYLKHMCILLSNWVLEGIFPCRIN